MAVLEQWGETKRQGSFSFLLTFSEDQKPVLSSKVLKAEADEHSAYSYSGLGLFAATLFLASLKNLFIDCPS